MAAPNSFFPRQTNPGLPLTSEFLGGESDTIREIPPEFRAALDLTVIEIPLPWDVLPVPLSDTVLASKAEQKVTSERMRRTTYKPPGQVPLVEHFTDKYKQFGLRTRTFKTEGDSVLMPNVTRDVNTKNLGNFHFIEDDEDSLTLFTEELWRVADLDPLPREFAAIFPTTEHSYVIPEVVSPPVLTANEIEHTSQQVNVFVGRETSKFRNLAGSLPRQLTEYRVTPEQQLMTITNTLDFGLQSLIITPETLLGEIIDLGNGMSTKRVGTVPNVFDRSTFEVSIPNTIPLEFRAIVPLHTDSIVVAGNASVIPLPLPTGFFESSDEDVTDLTHRTKSVYLDPLSLPAQLTSYKVTRDKQIATTIAKLDVGLQSLTGLISELTIDAEVTNLGNNLSVRKISTVTSLFIALEASTEIADLVPEFFKAVLPTHTEAQDIAGTVVDPPILSTGDFYKTERQLDVYTKRVTTRGRAGLSLPQSKVASRQLTEEYGGEQTQTTAYLNSSEPSVESGLGVVASSVKDLGNGLFLRETTKWDTATQWPVLVGTEVDPRTGIVIGITRQVVAAGTMGGVEADGYVDVKPIDKWRSIRIASKLDPTSLPGTVQWETTVEHSFPNTLLAATWLWASAFAPCCYEFDTALEIEMDQGYAGPCRARVTESFSNGPPTDVVSITQFFPKGHMVGYAWAFAENDTCHLCRANARTWSIPPSLHDAITIAGGVTLSHGTFTNVLPATTPTGLPASGTLITKSVDVERWRFGVFFRRITEIYVP